MDKILRYLMAILIDIIVGSSPFFNLSFYDTVAILLFGSAVYSLILNDLSILLPISLIPYTLLSHSYAPLIISSLSTALTYYLKDRATAFLLTLGISMSVFNFQAVYQVLAFVILIGLLVYLKVDIRGVIANGIFLLLIASIVAVNQGLSSSVVNTLSDGAYYSLAFGVFGLVIENASLPKKLPRIPLLFLPYALATLGFGTPPEYYWWSPNSFYFKVNPLSLWVPITYFPQVNQVLGSWPLSHVLEHFRLGVDLYLLILTYLAGAGSYLMFKRLKVRQAPLFSLVYQLLSPFPHPYLLLGYAVLPFTVYLMSTNLRNVMRYPAIMLSSAIGSSFVLFPISAILMGAFLRRRDLSLIAVAMVGANAFWIIPYLMLGGPVTGSVPSFVSLALLFPVLVVTAKFEDKTRVIISIGSLAYLLSGLPFSELAYPVVIASTLFLADGDGIKRVLAGITIMLLLVTALLQVASYHAVSIPPTVQEISKKVENATLVSWNYSCPLLSPVPINVSPIVPNAIQYFVNGKGEVIPTPNYTGFPASFKIVLPTNITRVNGTWIPETYAEDTLNSSFFPIVYKSPGLEVNVSHGITLKSLYGEQFIAWSVPNSGNITTILVSLSGTWVSYSGIPILFLGQNVTNQSSVTPINFTAVGLWLTKGGQIFLYGNKGFRLLPHGYPIPTSGSFNLNFYFLDQNNYTILEGEEINGRFNSLYINTTLPWNDVNAVGLILPIGDQLNVSQIQLPGFVPSVATQDWIFWNSPVPFRIAFHPSEPLNGTLYVKSNGSISLEVNGLPVRNGSMVGPIYSLSLLSSQGRVNVTSIYLLNNGFEDIIVGPLPVNTTYEIKVKHLLSGDELIISSHLRINMTIVPFGLTYKLDGVPFNTSNSTILILGPHPFDTLYSKILSPGTHVLDILFPGEMYLFLGIYISLFSFVVAMLSDIIRKAMIIKRVVEKILDKIEE